MDKHAKRNSRPVAGIRPVFWLGIGLLFSGLLAGAASGVTVSAIADPPGPVKVGDELTIRLVVEGWDAADGEVDAIDLKVDFDPVVLRYVAGSLKATDDGTEFLAQANQGAAYTLEDESDDSFADAGRVILSAFDANEPVGGSIGPSGSIGEFKLKAVSAGEATVRPNASNPNVVFSDPDLFGISPTGGIIVDVATIDVTPEVSVVTYESWASAQSFNTPADAETIANPDGDVHRNLMEYALGLDPLSPDNTGPAVGIHEVDGKRYVSLTYRRPSGDQERSDLIYTVERSVDLVTWSGDGVVEVSVSAPDPDTAMITVVQRSAFSVSGATAAGEYLRLAVSKL